MKIAFPTSDGVTIEAHFGRAAQYLVVTVDENKQETSRELRDKTSHGAHTHDHHNGHHHSHRGMVEPIVDCDVLICRGMGTPAYQAIQSAGVAVVPSRERKIDTVLIAYLNNTLVAYPRLIHKPDHH